MSIPACQRCNSEERIVGERFCKKCRKAVLRELDEAGYLTRVPRPTMRREGFRLCMVGGPNMWGNIVNAYEHVDDPRD